MANSMNTSPASLNYKHNKRAASKNMSSRTTYNAGFQGSAVKRIRTPHPHDVLSGRGGGINSHAGNITFRKWVGERKNDYNLAPNKAEKARVAREVIALVEQQSPPGRFLQKDPTSVGTATWWVELNDDKIMAKTSQALREGAPQIRAAHKDELATIRANHRRTNNNNNNPNNNNNKRSAPQQQQQQQPPRLGYVEPTVPSVVNDKPKAFVMEPATRDAVEMQRGGDEAERPTKRVRMEYRGQTILPDDATPPLMPTATPLTTNIEPLTMPQPLNIAPIASSSGRGLTRSHSLALSDMSIGDLGDDFVNPFENESEFETSSSFSSAPRPGVVRDSSLSSDMGGYGSLFKSDSSSKFGRNNSSGVRSLNSSSSSSRYDALDHWMREAMAAEPWVESQ